MKTASNHEALSVTPALTFILGSLAFWFLCVYGVTIG